MHLQLLQRTMPTQTRQRKEPRTGLQPQQIRQVLKTQVASQPPPPPMPIHRRKFQMLRHQVIQKRLQRTAQKIRLVQRTGQQRKMPSLLLKATHLQKERIRPQRRKHPQKTDQTLVQIF